MRMDSAEKSIIQDLNLAPEGRLKINWAQAHMPVLGRLREKLVIEKPLIGKKVAICLHLEAKTACLAELIRDAGAEVTICGSNPLSTQDDICAALVAEGIVVYAKYNPTPDEFKYYLTQSLEELPDLIIDDGGDLVSLLHAERPDLLRNVKGGCEETTTGILRLRSLEKSGELQFPMVAVNEAFSKFLFDNRYGTGQSVWDSMNKTTNLVVAGKTVVVVGYGWCGRGVALRAKGLGARVVVTEVDAISAAEAHMEGFSVMPMIEAAKQGDFFVTVTGNRHVIHGAHYPLLKDGAILANAGHFDVEINKDDLVEQSLSSHIVRENITAYTMEDGRQIYLLADGRLVNLAAGDGHPVEIMDMTFGLQTLCLLYINENAQRIGTQVIDVPYQIDEQVARYHLESLGVQIDDLSKEQQQYRENWKL